MKNGWYYTRRGFKFLKRTEENSLDALVLSMSDKQLTGPFKNLSKAKKDAVKHLNKIIKQVSSIKKRNCKK